jgi:hypothetical protein
LEAQGHRVFYGFFITPPFLQIISFNKGVKTILRLIKNKVADQIYVLIQIAHHQRAIVRKNLKHSKKL